MAVRLCCGQEHTGAQCPDGRVMCCLCFELFEVKDLHVVEGPDGPAVCEDVCVPCANHEDEYAQEPSCSRCGAGVWAGCACYEEEDV